MGMIDPQSCSSSNRASMDGTGDEKEEEAELLDGPLFLLTTGYFVIKVSPKLCRTKNLTQSPSVLS